MPKPSKKKTAKPNQKQRRSRKQRQNPGGKPRLEPDALAKTTSISVPHSVSEEWDRLKPMLNVKTTSELVQYFYRVFKEKVLPQLPDGVAKKLKCRGQT